MGWLIIELVSDASTDPRASGQPAGGVSEEEPDRAYAEQLRAAPADQVVVELLGNVLNVAQAKIGRNDARVFIDIAGLMFDQTRVHLPEELVGQVESMLGELRLVQVEAESMPGRTPEEGDLSAPPSQPSAAAGSVANTGTQDGSGRPPAPQPSGGQPGTGSAQSGSAASRLWLPGRDF